VSDWAMDKASELSLELNAEPFHKHANMIAAALLEAEARGRTSMKEEAAALLDVSASSFLLQAKGLTEAATLYTSFPGMPPFEKIDQMRRDADVLTGAAAAILALP